MTSHPSHSQLTTHLRTPRIPQWTFAFQSLSFRRLRSITSPSISRKAKHDPLAEVSALTQASNEVEEVDAHDC